VKYILTVSVLLCLAFGCARVPVVPLGPYPSSPLSLVLGGAPSVVAIGTPPPITGEGEYLLTIENQDDGARTEGDGEEVFETSIVEITELTTGQSLGTLTMTPCTAIYAVLECLDRPISVTVLFPDNTTQAVTVQASTRCFDRTFYIIRDVVEQTVDEDGDGQPDGDPVEVSVFKLSEANTNPRCSGGAGGGFGN
jgi:hypothetical protein